MVALSLQAHSLALPLEHQRDQQERHRKKGSFAQTAQPPAGKPPFLYNRLTSPSFLHHHGDFASSHVNPTGERIQVLCERGQLASALEALSLLQSSTSDGVYLALLRVCNRHKDLDPIKQVHEHLVHHSVDLTGPLGEYLAVTLAKHGSLEEALLVFLNLDQRSVFLWTAIMSACNQRRQSEKTLKLYYLMQEDGVEPDGYTFVTLLKACSNLRNLQEGVKIHAEARRKGATALDVYVSNGLVNMYGKCGNIVEAEGVFRAMPEHNFASWTSMISAYVDARQGEKALRLYRQMVQEHSLPNQHTFMIAIQACYSLSDSRNKFNGTFVNIMCLEIGHALHADAQRIGAVLDVFVCTTLVNMYGRLGRLKEAENVFVSVSQLDSSLCNAMLSAYLEQDQAETALQLYRHMMLLGLAPDQKTFVLALQACGDLAEKEEALVIEGQPTKVMAAEFCQALHTDARKRGISANVFFATTLLGVYAKCGILVEAEKVFGQFCKPDVVSWTAMISAYVGQDQGEVALQLFRQMQEEGLCANNQTFVVAIQACATLGAKVAGPAKEELLLDIGEALHADARKTGHDSDVVVGTALVGMYGMCGDIVKAESVFSTLPKRDLVAWNAMLTVYVEQGHGEKALQVFRNMLEGGIIPNQKTFVISLQACGILGEKEAAKNFGSDSPVKSMVWDLILGLHDDVRKRGFTSDVFIGNTLVTVYGNYGTLEEAENAFDMLSHHQIVSWNAMLSAYVQHSQGEKALQLYSRMQDEGTAVNDITLICILQACSQTGNLKLCKEIHFSIASAGYELNHSLASALIHAYGNCASMLDAQAVLDTLSLPDIVSWNACIAGYAGAGNYMSSLQMLEGMQLAGTKPDGVTLTSVLSACSHGGLVSQGLEYFESMCRDFDVPPTVKHFSSMTDLLGRAGDLKCVESVLERLPVHTDLSIWLPLLGACCAHGNTELGKKAFSNAINLEFEAASAFVVMSNIYSDFGFHEFTDEDKDCEWRKFDVG